MKNPFIKAFNIISALSLFFGFSLFVVNFGENNMKMYIFLGVAGFGVIGLSIVALIERANKRKVLGDDVQDNENVEHEKRPDKRNRDKYY